MSRIIGLLIWILALHAYFIFFVAFAAARKNQLIRLSTAVSGLATLWVFSMVAMKLGVAPGAVLWYRISIFALSLIPAMIYLLLRSLKGESVKTPIAIAVVTLSIVLALLTFTDFFYGLEVLNIDGSAIGDMKIDDLHEVVLHPRWGGIAIMLGESFVILLCIFKGWSIQGLKYRKLFIALSLLYWGSGLLSFILPFALPLELLGGLGCIILLMAVLRDRNALNMKLFIKPQFFPVFSGLFMLLLMLMLMLRDWGTLAEFKEAVLLPMLGSTLTVMLTTLLYEYLYSRFFTDRANYLMQCSTAYNRNILEMLGDVDRIGRSFLQTIYSVFGDGDIVLYLYESDIDSYVLKANGVYDTESFPVGSELTRLVSDMPRTTSASNVIDALDHNSLLYQEIWSGQLRWITPLKVKNDLMGFYFVGGFNMKNIDNMEKESIASLVKTTSLALQETYMMLKVERESRIDMLTGLYTVSVTKEAISERLGSGRPFLALAFSIDDIEFFNSVYDQSAGDELIRVFSASLKSLAGDKFMGRLSGKLFFLLMDGPLEEAIELDAALRTSFRLANEDGIRRHMTFSSGLLSIEGNEGYTVSDVISRSEMALLDAKRKGKNQLVCYEEGILDVFESGAYDFRMQTVDAITKAIDLKDHFTYGHSMNVASYARTLAEGAGLDSFECETIFQAGLVHDIGKISIPDSVLMNPGKLTDEEYEIIKTHVNRSEEVIRTLPLGYRMLPIALTHHERWDGLGYPNGLGGLDIPIGGRCLAIADTFDAMTSRRVYRKALSVDDALDEIERCSGTQFDPDLGPLFVKLVRDGKLTPHPYY